MKTWLTQRLDIYQSEFINKHLNKSTRNSIMLVYLRNCKNLQFLSLAFCTKISDKGFSYLSSGEGLKNIVYIDLSGCHAVNINKLLIFVI